MPSGGRYGQARRYFVIVGSCLQTEASLESGFNDILPHTSVLGAWSFPSVLTSCDCDIALSASIPYTHLFSVSEDQTVYKMGLEGPSFILAALTAAGGSIGYARTGSLPSIVAGLSVGALYALGGYRIQNNQPYGIELSLLASVVLAGSSLPRAIRLQKPVPIALSIVALYGLYTFGSAFRARL